MNLTDQFYQSNTLLVYRSRFTQKKKEKQIYKLSIRRLLDLNLLGRPQDGFRLYLYYYYYNVRLDVFFLASEKKIYDVLAV